jgi:hypothetical protein
MATDDVSLSRSEIMLREMYRDHFAIADKFEAAAARLHVSTSILQGTEGAPGVLQATEEAAKHLFQASESVEEMCDRLSMLKPIRDQLKCFPDRLLRFTDSRQFRDSLRSTLQEEHEKVVEAGREAATKLVSADLEEQMVVALQAAEQRVYGDTLIVQKTLLIQNEEFTAEIVRLNGVIAEMDKQKLEDAKKFASLAEDFGNRVMAVYLWRLLPVAVVSLVCGAALSLTPLFPMLLDMIGRR